jgi:GH35 family endo-1,4-beta-xylanase
MKKTILSVLLTSLALTASAQFGRNPDVNPDKGYKDTYQGYFTVGVAVNMGNINDPAQTEIIKKNYNSVTAENDMKPISVHPREGEWTWEKADAIANFCRQNGIKMRGHCLCWHSQFCDWMFTDKNGKEVSKEVFYQRLRDHILTVVNRTRML